MTKMQICTIDVEYRFNDNDLRCDNVSDAMAEPEDHATVISEDIHMALCRLIPEWKSLPGFERVRVSCYLNDCCDLDDGGYSAHYVVNLVCPMGVDVTSALISALTEVGIISSFSGGRVF